MIPLAFTQWSEIAMGVIVMFVLGSAVGNYACSVVYRLPRGQTPFERHPFCGHCNASLKPVDLFPIFSWLSTRGRCRYCGGEVPAIYTAIEMLCAAFFMAYLLVFGLDEPLIPWLAYASFVVIVAAIHRQQGWIAATPYSYALLMAGLARTLTEHTLYGWVQSCVLMLLPAVAVFRMRHPGGNPLQATHVWWWILLGAALPITQWASVLPLMAATHLLPPKAKLGAQCLLALIAPMLLAVGAS